MWVAFAFVILIVYILELRRQINEVKEEVTQLHKDFLAEVYIKYAEGFDGEE